MLTINIVCYIVLFLLSIISNKEDKVAIYNHKHFLPKQFILVARGAETCQKFLLDDFGLFMESDEDFKRGRNVT